MRIQAWRKGRCRLPGKNFRCWWRGTPPGKHFPAHSGGSGKTTAGTYQLDPQFVPPLIDLSVSEYLMAILRRLVEILAAKSNALSGTRRQKKSEPGRRLRLPTLPTSGCSIPRTATSPFSGIFLNPRRGIRRAYITRCSPWRGRSPHSHRPCRRATSRSMTMRISAPALPISTKAAVASGDRGSQQRRIAAPETHPALDLCGGSCQRQVFV